MGQLNRKNIKEDSNNLDWLNKKSDHIKIFKTLASPIKKLNLQSILDCGSGKTSLGLIQKFFPNVKDIDAVVYPGDDRKIDSIHEIFPKFNVLELDIVRDKIDKKYSLNLGHLLFGESLKFGNKLKNMVKAYFDIEADYYLIIDWYEDSSIDFNYIKEYAIKNNLELIKEFITPLNEKQFNKRLGIFAENYYGMLFKNNNN
jgi:hypothetical protein